MSRLTKLTSRKIPSRLCGHMTPQNPSPASSTNSKSALNFKEQEGRQFPVPWWHQKRSTCWKKINVQQRHQGMVPTIHLTQDAGNPQDFIPQISKEIGNHFRVRGLHHVGAEYLCSTSSPHQKSIMKQSSHHSKPRMECRTKGRICKDWHRPMNS